MDPEERIIVALDTDEAEALEIAAVLAGSARWLKVGMTLYYSAGPGIVSTFKEMGYQVFVDLKLHDIPHQVRGAARAVARAGADMLTVHASGGTAMMKAALQGAEEGYKEEVSHQDISRPLCLAITVLTSLDKHILESVGVSSSAEAQVLQLAALAKVAGMDGIVCSPQETSAVRKQAGEGFVLVTPGVRPVKSQPADQARVATPAAALGAGADYLVIGRPITESADPLGAFEAIVKELKK